MDRSEECPVSLIQNNISPSISDGLNFVMCEQTLRRKLKRMNAVRALLSEYYGVNNLKQKIMAEYFSCIIITKER